MAKNSIYNKSGKEVGSLDMPKEIFGLSWNADLVHQVMVSFQANKRSGTAHTKDRSEVSGGGKKPWKQKGTGRARHGSRRSPIWIGGGTTFGPRTEKDYSKKINKKMKTKALAVVLSKKAKDGEIILLDSVDLKNIKTKEASAILSNLSKAGFEKINYKTGNRSLIVTPEKNDVLIKSLRNIKSARVETVADINALDVLSYKYIVLENPEKSFTVLSERTGSKTKKERKVKVGTKKLATANK